MRYLYMALSAILLFASCNKKPDPSAPSRQDMLRKGKWKLASGKLTIKLPNAKDTILNYMTFLPDCYKDDYVVFDSLFYGKRYSGSTTCSPADPQYVQFVWNLRSNESIIDLYHGFNNLYEIEHTIKPYRFDTIQKDPLVLDTVLGVFDTLPGQFKQFLVLDTVREVHYKGIPVGSNNAGSPEGGYDIYNAELSNFSQSSFTLNFNLVTKYPDSTNFHAGEPNNLPPIMRPDTIHYSLLFTNF